MGKTICQEHNVEYVEVTREEMLDDFGITLPDGETSEWWYCPVCNANHTKSREV